MSFDITNATITSELPVRKTIRSSPKYDQLFDAIVENVLDVNDTDGNPAWLSFEATRRDQNNIRTCLQRRFKQIGASLKTRFDDAPTDEVPDAGTLFVRAVTGTTEDDSDEAAA